MQSEWHAYRKTFLSGEYAACLHGRGLILTYGPAFKTMISSTAQLSAFGQSVIKHYPMLTSCLAFKDTQPPHGGVGASSAELACIYQYLCDQGLEQPRDLLSKRTWYRQYAWDGMGLPPSGVDFIAQTKPGLIWVDCHQNTCHKLHWPFADYVWLVVKTNDKLDTHTHLKNIANDIDFTTLNTLLDPIKTSIEQANLEGFIQAQCHYDQTLYDLGLRTPTHQPYHDAIKEIPTVSYIRGNGAMGQDTWLILTKQSDLKNTINAVQTISSTDIHYTIDLNDYDTN